MDESRSLLQELSVYLDYLYEAVRTGNNKAIQAAKVFVLDCMGCIIVGSNDKATNIAKAYTEDYGGVGTSTVFGAKSFQTDAGNAALVNSIAAHTRDFDDIGRSLDGHPGSIILPTILAVGEKLNCSGMDFLGAYIVGVEAACILGKCLYKKDYPQGWESTCTIGVFGSAAASAKLMGLKNEKLTNALAIAANLSAGLRATYGTMTTDLIVGRAASNGIFCAEMAARGFGSNAFMLEGHSGFIELCTSGLDEKLLREEIQRKEPEVVSPGLVMKLYPSCRGTHNAIDAVLSIKDKHNICKQDVENIECICQKSALVNDLYPYPETKLQGKISMRYCVALCVLYGGVQMEDFIGGNIEDKDVIDLMQKISLTEDDTYFDDAICGTEVIIKCVGGEIRRCKVDYAKGEPQNPPNEEERRQKFTACAQYAYSEAGINNIIKETNSLEKIDSIRHWISIF
jgi:Uncharacterized protein involved in propionate catabolism